MHGIKSQSSVQAAAVVHAAIGNDDLELVVSRSGNVRLTYGPAKIFLKLINALDSTAREKRIEAAKSAVVNKLSAELESLGVQVSTAKAPVIKKLALAMTEKDVATGASPKSSASVVEDVVEDIVARSVDVIMKASTDTESKQLEYFWKAINHKRTSGSEADADTALSIAKTTIEWATSLQVDESTAFNAALNAHKLRQKKGIPLEQGKEILQIAGRLNKRHGFSEKDALQFAIDNYSTLQNLGVRMDSIEHIIKSLDEHIPDLRKMSQMTRIRAAFLYLQLQSSDPTKGEPIDEIRRSLPTLSPLPTAMRNGSKLDQIRRAVPFGMVISDTAGAVNRHILTVDGSKVADDLKNLVMENLKPENRIPKESEQIAQADEKSVAINKTTPPDETKFVFAGLNTKALADWGRMNWIFQKLEQLPDGKISATKEVLDKTATADVARKFRKFAGGLGDDGLQLLAAGMVQRATGAVYLQARESHTTEAGEAVMNAVDRKALATKVGEPLPINDSTTIQLTQLLDGNIEVKIVSLQRSNLLIDPATGDQISIESDFQSWKEPISEFNATSITTLRYTLDAESLRKRNWVLIGEAEASQVLQIPTPNI